MAGSFQKLLGFISILLSLVGWISCLHCIECFYFNTFSIDPSRSGRSFSFLARLFSFFTASSFSFFFCWSFSFSSHHTHHPICLVYYQLYFINEKSTHKLFTFQKWNLNKSSASSLNTLTIPIFPRFERNTIFKPILTKILTDHRQNKNKKTCTPRTGWLFATWNTAFLSSWF